MTPNADTGGQSRPDDGLGHYGDCGSQCVCYKAGFAAGYGQGRDDEANDMPSYQPPPNDSSGIGR